MLLLYDNDRMITVRDIDKTGSLKITNLVKKDTVVLKTLDIENLFVKSVALSSNKRLLFVAVEELNKKNSILLCYDLETKT